MHYYQHHIGDFIKDTANLDDHQLATYLRMIWAYYTDEKPFEDDCESIAFAMRSDEKTVRLVLKHYFVLGADGWRHGRCDKEIAAFRAKGEKARNSANARWKNANASAANEHPENANACERMQTHENRSGNRSKNDQNDANGMRTHSERNANEPLFDANQEPITNNQKPRKAKQDQDQKTTPASQPDWIKQLVALGADPKHCKDWMAVRKQKRAPAPTDTVIAAMQREARKANITVAAAVQICAERGWQGFKADWLANKPGGFGGGYSKADDVAAHNQAVVEEIARRQAQRTGSIGNPADPGIDEDGFLTIEGDFFHAP